MVHAKRITLLGIGVNFLLFLVKLAAAVAANSLAVLADAVNSLLDALYDVGIFGTVEASHRRADKGHRFATGRVEPMVLFVLALLMGISAFEILRTGVAGLLSGTVTTAIPWPVVAALLCCLLITFLLGQQELRAGELTGSPPLLAAARESWNDIVITLIAFAGLAFAATGLPWIDNVAAIVISLFLFRQVWMTAKENIAYLVGEAPPAELERRIREVVASVVGVRGIHRLSNHYVGKYAHVQLHILVSRQVTLAAAHAIAMAVQRDVELLPGVSKAFVHVEQL